MKYDESFINNNNSEKNQFKQLNNLFTDIMSSLEKGRSEIFSIGEECRRQSDRFKLELLEIQVETKEIVDKKNNIEKQEKQARIKLMNVSQHFNKYTQDNIKEAYDEANDLQIALVELRNQEIYLKKRKDEITQQIKQFEQIAKRAETFLNATGVALKYLKANVESINNSLTDIYRKQNIEMWIIEAQESERRKIARELHDGPAQTLASMMIRLDLISHLWNDATEQIVTELSSVKAMGKESLADIRCLMFDLKPTLAHAEGLALTLQEYFNDFETKYNFYIEYTIFGSIKRYDLSLEMAIYRLVQEALTNVRKHAGTNKALIKMEDKAGLLTIVIKDEGKGFDLEIVKNKQESYGIWGMKERVELFGGEIDIISSIGQGTQVIIKVPIKEEANKHGKDKGHNS